MSWLQGPRVLGIVSSAPLPHVPLWFLVQTTGSLPPPHTCFQPGVLGWPLACLGRTLRTKLHAADRPRAGCVCEPRAEPELPPEGLELQAGHGPWECKWGQWWRCSCFLSPFCTRVVTDARPHQANAAMAAALQHPKARGDIKTLVTKQRGPQPTDIQRFEPGGQASGLGSPPPLLEWS